MNHVASRRTRPPRAGSFCGHREHCVSGHGRASADIRRLGDGLTIGLGLSYAAFPNETPHPLASAERHVAGLTLANAVEPVAGDAARRAAP